MTMTKIRNTCVVVWLVLGLAAPALASPTSFVKNILDEVMAIQNNPSKGESARAQAIGRIIQRSFDFPYMAQESLGAAYNSLSSGQRQEFTEVFSSLFQTSYTNMVLRFLKRETVEYGQETQRGGQAEVKTKLVRTNDTIAVDYLLHQKGGGWLLYDVKVDGVSLLDKYKAGFAREIKAHSFQSLIQKMKTQLKSVQ
jgi:phospholipid transport system substrate-binding protein